MKTLYNLYIHIYIDICMYTSLKNSFIRSAENGSNGPAAALFAPHSDLLGVDDGLVGSALGPGKLHDCPQPAPTPMLLEWL